MSEIFLEHRAQKKQGNKQRSLSITSYKQESKIHFVVVDKQNKNDRLLVVVYRKVIEICSLKEFQASRQKKDG